MNERYRYMIDRISEYDRGLATRIRDWYPAGENDLILILDDGSKVQYDGTNHTFRWLADYLERSDRMLTEEEHKREFANKLRLLMYSNGYGQENLAEATGISQASISKYLRGLALPGYLNLMRISHALNCSISELTTYIR